MNGAGIKPRMVRFNPEAMAKCKICLLDHDGFYVALPEKA